jgi:hypothetical protein
MNIIEAIKDESLFGPFLGNDLKSWWNWLAAFRALYGLHIPKARREIVAACTGRKPSLLPIDGFQQALFLVGRRSGKSRAAALIGANEAILAGHEVKLAKGERGVVAVCAPTKYQARIVKDYLRAIFDTPLLKNEVTDETKQGFDLRNRTRIEILAGDWRTIRGYTLLAAIVDEVAFFGYDAESKVKSDSELIRSIKPALATTGGKLIAITSPYARKGWSYATHKKNFGNDDGKVLVWNAASRVMNPTLPQSVVDEAMADDLQSAKSEYLAEFRDDVAEFISLALVESLVIRGRHELLPDPKRHYCAFVDVSGGRHDDSALAIAHRERGTALLDFAERYRSPASPHEVISRMAAVLKRYRIRNVCGDNYAADFVVQTFARHGIYYAKSPKPKAELYAELLPRLCSRGVELLDNKVLVQQLAGLERRTRSGGRDLIDHAPGCHDDLANAVAGVVTNVVRPVLEIGVL